jgi:hypothetical protein
MSRNWASEDPVLGSVGRSWNTGMVSSWTFLLVRIFSREVLFRRDFPLEWMERHLVQGGREEWEEEERREIRFQLSQDLLSRRFIDQPLTKPSRAAFKV